MKKILIILLTLGLTHTAFSQIEKTSYKILDEIRSDYGELFSTKTATLIYRLVIINNLSSDQEIVGIEVEVFSSELLATGGSIGFSNFGRIWGASTNLNLQQLNRQGLIFLKIEDALEAFNFLNDYFVKIHSKNPEFYENYKVTVNEEMEMGYFYETKENAWKFFTSVNGIIYSMDIIEGVQLLSALGKFTRDNIKP